MGAYNQNLTVSIKQIKPSLRCFVFYLIETEKSDCRQIYMTIGNLILLINIRKSRGLQKNYHKKNEGFLTHHLSALYKILVSVSEQNILNGADYGNRTHDPRDHNPML